MTNKTLIFVAMLATFVTGAFAMHTYQNATQPSLTKINSRNITSQTTINQADVTARVSQYLKDFTTQHSVFIQQTQDYSRIKDNFEELYLDTYENELASQFPGEANEDIIEDAIDEALATINFSSEIFKVQNP